jgi:glutamate/tyrosine decarboxylase-like PLP-dependent enzyme
MSNRFRDDLADLPALLARVKEEAERYIATIDERPPAASIADRTPDRLQEEGLGASAALDVFMQEIVPGLTGSSGARYWGFVTGGTTPAALVGDWLVSLYDINLADKSHSSAPQIERAAIAMLRQLFGLPADFVGVFVSGATMANFVGLATGREWVASQRGYSAAQSGLFSQKPIRVLTAAPHSSAVKSLAMLGLGRESILSIPRLPGNREAIDPNALAAALDALNGDPCIILASAGTVNTVDFDDLQAIRALRERYPFWLHVDGAFGGFAACSPRFQHLLAGLGDADSVTIDAHKWLNVPYDSAMIFTRQPKYQLDVFQNNGAYLPELGDNPDYFHYTPENSRRWRALPTWFTLMAYGRRGYQDVVERCCDVAAELGRRIETSTGFRLLAPVRMNVVCFTLQGSDDPATLRTQVAGVLERLRDGGKLFLTPTTYNGVPGMRAALVNWRTGPADLEIGWQALLEAL